jgi:glycosyltransferase involved in cell wall biosynthesis
VVAAACHVRDSFNDLGRALFSVRRDTAFYHSGTILHGALGDPERAFEDVAPAVEGGRSDLKFSIVTISFNQREFLERAIRSVIEQHGVEIEYIIVDPGSTDGSRDIIEAHRPHFAHVILERDAGPADGLNKGFALATGDVYGFLNSDDTLEAGALAEVATWFEQHRDIDVVSGHAWISDRDDSRLRRIWSEPFERLPVAYGAAILIQPSTFFRRGAYLASGGFNVQNRSNWDGELMVDLYLSGARFAIIDAFLSCYRLHDVSITNSGVLDAQIRAWSAKRFEKLMGREPDGADRFVSLALRAAKHARRPAAFVERLRYGPVYRRGIR